jgi:hypothetical protein
MFKDPVVGVMASIIFGMFLIGMVILSENNMLRSREEERERAEHIAPVGSR